MRIDLHLHTTASDGAFPPAEVVARARAAGLDIIAIADHDTAAGVPEAVAAAAADSGVGGAAAGAGAGAGAASPTPHVVPALEISARHGDRDLHVLGYFIDPEHPAIVSYSTRARVARERRIRAMIERLAALGVDVPFGEVLREAGPGAHALARPHLARAMVALERVPTIAAAFDRFIGDDGPAFVPTDLLDVPGAIGLIHTAGGVAVWAHPPPATAVESLEGFADAGLDGVECYRPRVRRAERRPLLAAARRLGLLVTGGSDWHGDWHGELGTFHVGPEEVGGFLARGGLGIS